MFRLTFSKNGFRSLVGMRSNLDAALPSFCILPSRTITLKKYLKPKKKPKPFPYNERYWSIFYSFFDHMFDRFDENTKIIVVDGQISIGKHKFAKKLAEELGMKYMPDITTDVMYINRYGYDYRNLDWKLPETVQSYDEKRFNVEPTHFLAATFQANKLRLRYSNYWEALTHLMHTGQGVVIVRSPYSDHIFANAMAECGYMSEPARFTYKEIVRHTMLFLMRPHLIIYLGANVESTMENIKKKNIDYLTKSKAMTPMFLEWIDKLHKNYMNEASAHSHTLVYDMSDGGDSEVILEDIERLDFEKERHFTDPKFNDWLHIEEEELEEKRFLYTSRKEQTMNYFHTPEVYEAPEMFISANDFAIWEQVMQSAPSNEYDDGFNEAYGDKIWFKKSSRVRFWDPFA